MLNHGRKKEKKALLPYQAKTKKSGHHARTVSIEESEKKASSHQIKKTQKENKKLLRKDKKLAQKLSRKKGKKILLSKYFSYDETTKKFKRRPGKRPINQSHRNVLKKINCRIKKLPTECLTNVQVTFVKLYEQHKGKDKFIGKNQIDIAHNISIDSMMDGIKQYLNKPDTFDGKAVNAFVDEIISSDDEAKVDKSKIKKHFNTIRNQGKSPTTKMDSAVFIANRLNKASKNLMPGHKKTNSAIQEHRDPHMIKDGKDGYIETKISRDLAISARALVGRHKPRYHPDDGKKVLSSSIDMNKDKMNRDKAWVRYESPSPR